MLDRSQCLGLLLSAAKLRYLLVVISAVTTRLNCAPNECVAYSIGILDILYDHASDGF